MKRVASLYLPGWSIDRIRRRERTHAPPPERAAAVAGAGLLALKQAGDAEQGGKACDSPKNTGWRPGARWARDDDSGAMSRPLPGVDEATGGADACWAGETRADVERRIARIPAHQRPPMREMGRRSEAADHPYKRLPGDDGGKASGWPEPAMVPVRGSGEGVRGSGEGVRRDAAAQMAAWNAMPAIRYPGDGPYPDKLAAKERRPGSNDPHARVKEVAAFFDTGRSTAGTVARVCRDTTTIQTAATPAAPGTPECWYEHHPATPFVPGAAEERGRSAAPYASLDGDAAGPLVTVNRNGSRIEIAAVSPEAWTIGIEPGMALTQVRAATPDVAVRDADPEGDRADLIRLSTTLARRWAPMVAMSDDDGIFIELTGVAHLHGGEAQMARRLVRLLARHGFAARIGIADTAGAAWALARFAGSAVAIAPPGDPLAAIAAFPVAALRLGDAAVELARSLGIDSVAALVAMPRGPLSRRFGPGTLLRIDQASGRVAEPIDPVTPPEPIVVEQRFAEPLITAEPIAHWIGTLVTRIATMLAGRGRGARTLVLAATRVDAAVQTIRIGFARPTRDVPHMLRLLVRQVERIDPGFGIEALALHVLRADPLGPEATGRDLADEAAPDLAPLVDTLVNRIGAHRLWRTRAVESDVPERTVAAAAPLDNADTASLRLKRDDVRRLDLRAADHPWHRRWPRPARLLRRPEPVDHVVAELPDNPPKRFTWRGERHLIVRADGPERITGEWWRRSAERDAVRDYFQVEDEEGRRFWLFRRGDGERAETGDLSWFIHGTFA